MRSASPVEPNIDLHKIQQIAKWIVYSLLIVNFAFYIYEDWYRAVHTLTPDSTIADWAREFATSIDELAWFLLLFMFELETYVLEDERRQGWVSHAVHGIRMVCLIMIAHTIFAYASTTVEYDETLPVAHAESLCDLADEDVTFVYNLEYIAIDDQNCSELSGESPYYWLGENPLVTTRAGLELERNLAWADLIEAASWLVIVLSIESVVRLHRKGIAAGRLVRTFNNIKLLFYTFLIAISVYWAMLGHWLYVWDEFVWIAGFAAIEINVNEWRGELTRGRGKAG